MLSKRKDLLAAADSSIQFSLQKNKDLFANEIGDVTSQFEEEEKAAAEAKKLAEKDLAESSLTNELEKASELDDDIPPPPPPPPPNRHHGLSGTPISGNDTALLIQESVFQEGAFSSSNHTSEFSSMNISDLLANVQSSDFASHQPKASPGPEVEGTFSHNVTTIPCLKEREQSREEKKSPKAGHSSASVSLSKEDIAKEVYQYERDEKQFSHYEQHSSSYSDHESRDTKYQDKYYDYSSEYKKSHKSRKYFDDYRERSSSSKHSHSRERSLSPRSRERYLKEYSVRDYSHGIDRLFKSPDYYLSLSRSTSSRSSSKELSSRERRQREDDWYGRHHHSSKHSYSSSLKYPDMPRRDEYYRDYYDKKRYEDSHYKSSSSSERSKSKDYALYESSRSAAYEMYKIRETAYDMTKLRESVDVPKFKESGHSKYYSDLEYDDQKKRGRDHPSTPKLKMESHKSSSDSISQHAHTEEPYSFEEYHRDDISEKNLKEGTPRSASPKEPPPPPPVKAFSPPKRTDFSSDEASKSEPDSSVSHSQDSNQFNSKPPKTPEEMYPCLERESSLTPTDDTITDSVVSKNAKMETFGRPNLVIEEQCGSHKQALIDSILPKPKYCSILKETFAPEQDKATPDDCIINESESLSAETERSTEEEQIIAKSDIDQVVKELADTEDFEENDVNTDAPVTSEPMVLQPTATDDDPYFSNNRSSLDLSLTAEPSTEVTPTESSFKLGILTTKDDNQVFSEEMQNEGESVPSDFPSEGKGSHDASGVKTPTKEVSQNSDDAEEGEIVSDSEEKLPKEISKSVVTDSCNENVLMEEVGNSSSASENTTQPLPKAFVPDENFPIRSKRDFFKARFFQPDMKIDFAKPEQESEKNESVSMSEDTEKLTASATLNEPKPNPDEMRYSRKMRFKEVLQQHINEQELKGNIRKDAQEAPKDIPSETSNALPDVSDPNIVDAIGKSVQSAASIKIDDGSPNNLLLQPTVSKAEQEVSAVSLIGKRKRFLNDYIASLESNPPPTKASKADEVLSEESLPRLRIKPLSGGSYCSETMVTSASSAPPPLHRASTPTPEKEAVPKCIIKLGGQGNWSTCESEKQESTRGKRRSRHTARQNLRSREASNDSNKSGTPEKPRVTRSKNTAKRSVKSYDMEDDEKNSDNSFEDADKSRKSGRTRKTIKRLNL